MSRGYSQAKVAKYLHISQSTYAGYESGTSRIPLYAVIEIAEYLETTPSVIISGYDIVPTDIITEDGLHKSIMQYISLDSHGKRAVGGLIAEEVSRMQEDLERDKAIKELERLRKEYTIENQDEGNPKLVYTRYPGGGLWVYNADEFEADEESDDWIEERLYENAVSAGRGTYLSSDNYEAMRFHPDAINRHSDFALRIHGNSMEPTILDGDIVFVESCPRIESEEIGIFIIGNEEGYCKKLSIDYDKNEVWLISLNDDYDDICIKPDDELITVGRVVGIYRED
jgi:phage repressor protein C with HTH and peptisase S24 domain/DNA-binding XRE family transcriptional regulator